MLYFLTIFTLLVIMFSLYSVGFFAKYLFNVNSKATTSLSLGLIIILGTGNLFVYPIVYYNLSVLYLYLVYSLIIIIGFLFGIYSFLIRKAVKVDLLFLFLIASYIIIMIFITSRFSLAEESFDTVHYLQVIQQTLFSPTFIWFDADSGTLKKFVYSLDDYQSYYYFMSYISTILESIVIKLSSDIIPIITGSFIWIFSILFFAFEFSVVYTIIDYFKVKSNLIKLGIGIFTLLFIGNFYYNNVFAFYGNSYRSIFSALLMFLIYKIYKEDSLNIKNSILLMLVSSSLISVSASGYFIGFFIIYGFVYLISKKKFNRYTLLNLMIILIPTFLFVMFYFSNYLPIILIFVILMFAFVMLLYYWNNLKIINSIRMIIRFMMKYVVPSAILIYSIYLYTIGYKEIDIFFRNYSAGDMVWDYFDFINPKNIVVNLLYWISCIYYLTSSKNDFRHYIFIVFITFVNPISVAFLFKFMTYTIFYRAYESIFNIFFIILILVHLLESKILERIKNKVAIGFIVISIVLSIYQITNYYHFFFIPEKDFSVFNRIREPEVEVFNVLKTKIIIEDYERAKVISQINSVKGFVPRVETPITYNQLRLIDRFSNSQNELSALHNIFIYRDYMSQAIFNTPPDYKNTCQYLIDYKADFVIVAKNQSYIEDGEYKFLYHRVRECATQVFENEEYYIYQFFWK